jgi:hypothetical protein
VKAGEENAGLVDIGDGLGCVFKIESHNHPSALEPYQGAATGVGGINRDIFTMGARPIAQLNSLRFGNIEEARTKWLVKVSLKASETTAMLLAFQSLAAKFSSTNLTTPIRWSMLSLRVSSTPKKSFQQLQKAQATLCLLSVLPLVKTASLVLLLPPKTSPKNLPTTSHRFKLAILSWKNSF